MFVAIHVSVFGLYRAPVLVGVIPGTSPPQTIISLPVQTAECHRLRSGAFVSVLGFQVSVAGVLVVRIGVQVSDVGSYLPPVLNVSPYPPPKTIISLPVQMVVCVSRGDGALIVLIGLQIFVAGLYRLPEFT